jgi:hypothetical protein
MPDNALFISYGHLDMSPTNWLERLKLYLAPFRRRELVEIWDDSKIRAGSEWRNEIRAATERATSAILLVGPAFLASEFITNDELPSLLAAAENRGGRIYPLVVGYCGYKQSVLEKYQAFNDPEKPLEALTTAEQNKILNQVSLIVDEDLRHQEAKPNRPEKMLIADTRTAMEEIAKELQITRTAFVAQCSRRDLLVQAIKDRLNLRDNMEYENFFFRYFNKLNDEEKFQFDQIRAMTEGPLHEGNQNILHVIEGQPRVLAEIPALADLRQHLVFWLNKYEKVFLKRAEMSLLYTGVEDGVPFPNGVDEKVRKWIKTHA